MTGDFQVVVPREAIDDISKQVGLPLNLIILGFGFVLLGAMILGFGINGTSIQQVGSGSFHRESNGLLIGLGLLSIIFGIACLIYAFCSRSALISVTIRNRYFPYQQYYSDEKGELVISIASRQLLSNPFLTERKS